MRAFILLTLLGLCCGSAWAEPIDANRLADAIYKAEGGASTNWPYGILKRYKHTTPRQACLNTIRSKHKAWVAQGSKGDFIAYLGSKYAPIGADNDPTGLNAHWVGNVSRFYRESLKNEKRHGGYKRATAKP